MFGVLQGGRIALPETPEPLVGIARRLIDELNRQLVRAADRIGETGGEHRAGRTQIDFLTNHLGTVSGIDRQTNRIDAEGIVGVLGLLHVSGEKIIAEVPGPVRLIFAGLRSVFEEDGQPLRVKFKVGLTDVLAHIEGLTGLIGTALRVGGRQTDLEGARFRVGVRRTLQGRSIAVTELPEPLNSIGT